jgi:hypothetical protein
MHARESGHGNDDKCGMRLRAGKRPWRFTELRCIERLDPQCGVEDVWWIPWASIPLFPPHAGIVVDNCSGKPGQRGKEAPRRPASFDGRSRPKGPRKPPSLARSQWVYLWARYPMLPPKVGSDGRWAESSGPQPPDFIMGTPWRCALLSLGRAIPRILSLLRAGASCFPPDASLGP